MSSRCVAFRLIFILTSLLWFTAASHAAQGDLLKVTIDYWISLSTKIAGYTLAQNERLVIDRGSRFTVSVWKTEAGSAPWVFKLIPPSGPVISSTISGANRFSYFEAGGEGTWTAQVDDGRQLSWTVAYGPYGVPVVTGLSTVPSSPTPGQQFALTVNGANFDPDTVRVLVTGPGCAPCIIANTSLTVRAVNRVSGPITLNSGGSFSIVVQNAETGRQSPALSLLVEVPAQSATPPTFDGDGIVSAATYRSPLSRGSVASLFGSHLADSTVAAESVPLPRILVGVKVKVNGVDAPLWFVSPKQINFQIPYESPLAGSAYVQVLRSGLESRVAEIELHPYTPGVFTYVTSEGTAAPIVTHADGSLISAAKPAFPGESVIIWGTGIGDLVATPSTGDVTPSSPLATTRVDPIITIGDVPAEVKFAGLTPGAIGLAQFNVRLPDSLPSGSPLMLVIRFSNGSSPPVPLFIEVK